MSPLNKTKVYRWIIGALILFNLLSLLAHWLPHRPPPPIPPAKFLAKILDFDQEQRKTLEQMNFTHQKEVYSYLDKMHTLKDSLLRGTSKNQISDETAQKLIDQIAQVQAQLEKSTFLHLKGLRALCRDKQIDKFDRMIQRILKHKLPPRPRGFPPPI